MTRSQEPGLPQQADRPAEELYGTLAKYSSLPTELGIAARNAASAIAATALAHGGSKNFAPFGEESYRDAAGSTVYFPIRKKQIDPWAPTYPKHKMYLRGM